MEDIPAGWQQRRTDEELRDLRKIVTEMVPRTEHEVIWRYDQDWKARVQKQLDEFSDKLENFKEEVSGEFKIIRDMINDHETARLRGQLPIWALPFLAVCVPAIVALANHFWK